MTTTTRNLTLAVLATAILATSGIAYARDGDGPRGGMMRIIQQIDANDDGNYALDELTTFLDARFEEADADANASLTSAELGEAIMQRAKRAERAERAGERMIERIDIDGDGAVTLAELNERATKLFVLLDVDNSGVIEADEMPQRGEGRRGNR